MRIFTFIAILWLAVVLFAVASLARAETTPETQMLDAINAYRLQSGVPALHRTATLDNATEWHAGDMAQNHYFNHFDSLGRDPWARMCDFGYCYNAWKGENIAAGYATATEALQGWIGSPGHNAILLDARYTVVGIGQVFVSGSDYGTYWSADFASVNPNPAPTITPAPSKTPKPTPKCMLWWRCRR